MRRIASTGIEHQRSMRAPSTCLQAAEASTNERAIMKTTLFAFLAVAAIALAAPASITLAQTDHAGHHDAQSESTHTGIGVVRFVDMPTAEIDIAHEPMPSLKWPAMRMTFKAHDAALLQGLKTGDKVEFDIVKMGNEYHVTRIAPAR
jgi:Cu(I)/Ag(I) efflux system periplasmic protein CusF